MKGLRNERAKFRSYYLCTYMLCISSRLYVSEVNILSVGKSVGIVNVNILFMWIHFWCVSKKTKCSSTIFITFWKMCEIQSLFLSVNFSYYKMNKLNVKTTVNVWLLCGLIKAGCLDSLVNMKWAYINENRFLTSIICQWIELLELKYSIRLHELDSLEWFQTW